MNPWNFSISGHRCFGYLRLFNCQRNKYDAATNSVYIDSGVHYQNEVAQPTSITEESVQATLWKLMEQYPNGTPYGAPYRSISNGPYSGGMNCAGWATLCSDASFGNLPWRRITDPRWEDIRPGDLIRFDTSSSSHVVVVLDKTDEYILITESGTHNKALWGGQYFRWWLEQQHGYTLYTRYPQ